jgi:hypothetical protein
LWPPRGADLCGWLAFSVIEEIAQNGSVCQLAGEAGISGINSEACGLRPAETSTDWPGGSPTATAFPVSWWPVSGAGTGSPDSRL